ncbi:hypothetical protein pb186bvf_001759 [Paramecium bursaria]
MDRETIKRVKGDFNQTMKMNSEQSQGYLGTYQSQLQSQDLTEKTYSLTILFNNMIDLNLKEIIETFDHDLLEGMILAERSQFDNISQLENQRIVLHLYRDSLVLAGYQTQLKKLVVSKLIKADSQETLIQYLDEYKIHYRINQLFPSQSLALILPVRVSKEPKYFEIAACMERAEFNLFDYSRNQKIGDDEAMNIFVQIIDQIINLHSVNIAHRDIKLQNIFYVIDKGWLLSDFGESLEYEEVDCFYNIRGTKYFLMPALQLSINKNSKVNQNLITNDTYALVVSMIMIKNQQYINDMQEQVENLKDYLLHRAIKLCNLSELQQFRKQIKFIVGKDLININISCQKEMNSEEQSLNQKCIFQSYMGYFVYQNQINADSDWLEQILQLIKRNLSLIQQNFNSVFGATLIKLSIYQQARSQFELNNNWIQIIQNKPPNQQEFYIKLSFIYGFTEKTIYYATEYLKTNYSQSVHLILIDAYYRANMVQEAEQQLQQFHEGMIFDQLNTYSQDKYLQYLKFFDGEQQKYNVQFDFNIDQELINRGYQISDQLMIELQNELQNNFQNQEKIVNSIIKRIDIMCINFSVLNLEFCLVILQYVLDQPIQILLSILQRIYQQNYQQFDTNKKFNFLIQIAEFFILLNQRKEFLQNLKQIKQSAFFSESREQTVSFKILYQVIFQMEYAFQQENCKFNVNLQLRNFINQLKKIKYIKFKCYYQYILFSLLNLIKILETNKIYHKSPHLVHIIQFIINMLTKQNFQISDKDYILYYNYVQYILLELKNNQRSILLAQQQNNRINFITSQTIIHKKMDKLNYFIRPSIKKVLGIKSKVWQIAKREFLFNRYFDL